MKSPGFNRGRQSVGGRGFPSASSPIPSAPERSELRKQHLWEQRLNELLEFRRVHGHVHVPRDWAENPRLATWVGNQRRLVRLELIHPERLGRLEQLGISWGGLRERREAQQEAWDRMFSTLRAFHRAHGHLVVPRRWAPEPLLAPWLATQRFLHRTGALPDDRRRGLSGLDREWHRQSPAPKPPPPPAPRHGSRADAFRVRMTALEKYRDDHGNCSVPTRWAADPILARWVANQRSLRKRGLLSRARIEELDRLGFDWSGMPQRAARRDQRWEEMASALEAFRRAHGHAEVPLGWSGNRPLSIWVFRQRNEQRKGNLRPDRKVQLDALGFSWNPSEPAEGEGTRSWEERFAGLAAYAKRHRHADVADDAEHRDLFRWLEGQRRRRRTGKLDPALARRMESVGVHWNPRDAKWDLRYAELSAYREEHGDCAIDMSGRENAPLSRWVSSQRSAFKSGLLSAERRAKLEAIGFIWEAPTVHRKPSASER